MTKRPESPRGFLKQIPLWQLGALLIIWGLLTNQLVATLGPQGTDNAARGFAFGRGLAAFLFVVAGLVLIVLHFVRGRPKQRKKRPVEQADSARQ